MTEAGLVCSIETEREKVFTAIEAAAEQWGAEWQRSGLGGKITLPISAGLRHALARGEVMTSREGSGTRLDLELHPIEYRLHRPAVGVLAIGAAGALAMMLVPLFPVLAPFLPLSFLALLLAWFMVLSQVKNRSPEDFLSVVCEIAEEQCSQRTGPQRTGS